MLVVVGAAAAENLGLVKGTKIQAEEIWVVARWAAAAAAAVVVAGFAAELQLG